MENPGGNQTPIVELILVGFGNGPELQPPLFLLFLVIYLAAVAGNLLIVVLVVADRHLHTPMYYFLANLSAVEICSVSTSLPRLIGSLATGDRTISLQNCYVQFHFGVILSTTQGHLLTAMCIDRYLAICHPLRYPALMNGRVCCHMVAWAWIIAISYSIMLEMLILQLTYCGPKEFDHLVCDFAPTNSFCGRADKLSIGTNYVSIILALTNFLLSLASYTSIIISILRIRSSTGRQKAFSTCSSHLIVVTIFNVCVIINYVVPVFRPSPLQYKILSVFYGSLIPLINPVLYSLRNKEVKQALRTTIEKLAAFRHRHRV
ncbi:olfactory receptor 6C75-like [Pelodiscus sinensis]|uniref:olfactory receptor 6C75-like n=1 Tax=Pelodiscus sinensis TaxID=13735 RepID=UPI003F6A8A0E